MPDLHTEMQKIAEKIQPKEKQVNTELKGTISKWASDDTQEPDVKHRVGHRFAPTNNVSRETFYAVRDNPGKIHSEIVRILEAKGFNPTSVGSLMAQMVNCGMAVRDELGRYTATQQEYTPIRNVASSKKKKPKTKPDTKRPYVRSGKYAKTGIAALQTQAEVVAAATPAPTKKFDPSSLLSTLSFPQVMALYKQIKTMLGEA
jgi:hypothetical protein